MSILFHFLQFISKTLPTFDVFLCQLRLYFYIHVYTLLIVFPKLEIDISVSFSIRMSVVSCNLV